MITREYLHEILVWAERELTGFSPLNLEGQHVRVIIIESLKMGLPLDAVEEHVVALHRILETLQEERRMMGSRSAAKQLLLTIPENQDHLHLLETYPDIPETLRSFMISEFLQGENYGN